MINAKELLQKIESGDVSYEDKLAALGQVETALKEMRERKETILNDRVGMIVDALKTMQRKVEAKLEEVKAIVPEVGPAGPKGEPGERGLDGTSGRDGRDGVDGRNGVDGQDGVSVTDAKIDFDGSLVITLSTGREINVGEVVAPDLAEKIKVITNGGGTSQSVLDAIAALQTQIDNLIPSQTGNAGKFLTTDGTNTSWATVAGGGAVDSVNGQTGVVVLDAADVGASVPITVQDEGSTLTSAATSLNFTGAGVTATNTGGAVTVAITGGGSGISSADIQEFTSTGTSTWTKPAGAKLVYVLLFSGGGGGGSGRRRNVADTALAGGGTGGPAGGRVEAWIPAVELGSTESVVVGAGGTGGAARTVDNTNGLAGGPGEASTFSFFLAREATNGGGGGSSTGAGSGGSSGGTNTSATTFAATFYTANGGAGSSGTANPTAAPRGGMQGGGGGGGGGIAANGTTTYTPAAGGLGGAVYSSFVTSTGGGGAAGTSGVTATSGTSGAVASTDFFGGSGGGGGGSATVGTAGSGGNGGYPGGGGGGGGSSNSGFNSGAGGNGGDGYVRVVTFF